MIVAFTGTRQGLPWKQRHTLEAVMEYLQPTRQHTLVHGGCVGADIEAHNHARMLGWRTEVYPAVGPSLWGTCDCTVLHLPMEPLARNHVIVDRGELLIACPQGVEGVRSGTWSTIRYARKRGTRGTIIWPDGSTSTL